MIVFSIPNRKAYMFALPYAEKETYRREGILPSCFETRQRKREKRDVSKDGSGWMYL